MLLIIELVDASTVVECPETKVYILVISRELVSSQVVFKCFVPVVKCLEAVSSVGPHSPVIRLKRYSFVKQCNGFRVLLFIVQKSSHFIVRQSNLVQQLRLNRGVFQGLIGQLQIAQCLFVLLLSSVDIGFHDQQVGAVWVQFKTSLDVDDAFVQLAIDQEVLGFLVKGLHLWADQSDEQLNQRVFCVDVVCIPHQLVSLREFGDAPLDERQQQQQLYLLWSFLDANFKFLKCKHPIVSLEKRKAVAQMLTDFGVRLH